jgi:hypothetical protein
MSERDDARFEGTTIPDPAFATDDGSADPGLASVLEQYAAGGLAEAVVVVALQGQRLMLPLVAVLDEQGESAQGLRVEKSSHMATVSLVSRDGRRGLLAFTSTASLIAWDPAARGIPVTVGRAAAAAIEGGADALLLDLAGPVRFALHGDALRATAAGTVWSRPYDDPEVGDAVSDVLAEVVGLDGFEVEPGPAYTGQPGPDIVVVITPDEEFDVTLLADDVATRLADNTLLQDRCPSGIGVGIREDDDPDALV